MIRMIRTAATAALLAVGFAAVTPVGLASAQTTKIVNGKQVTIHYAPQDQVQHDKLTGGLQMFGQANGLGNGAGIVQKGSGNAAGMVQNGQGNHGIIYQQGNGHTGTLQQQGNGNSYGLLQFGHGTTGHIGQTGNGQAGVTVQYGWK